MATNYYNEKFAIETDFLNTANAILAEAKEAYEATRAPGYRTEWDERRPALVRQLEAAKEKAIEREAAMFDRMRADLDKAHAKPLTEGQAANLQAVALVGVSNDNAASALESVRGNSTGVTTLIKLAERSGARFDAMLDLPVKPLPLDILKKGLGQVQGNRKERIMRYGGYGTIDVSGPDCEFFMPEGKDKRMTDAQEFLDEYGA